ncbi:hypothetical protein Taro_002995, partial [Colocasia esculenta]|nr:hypothetical protein [Colocasia esculenta]
VHTSLRDIAFLLLLRLLPSVVHALLWGPTLPFSLLPWLLPLVVHTPLRQLDSWFGRTVVPALHAMGVAFPHPPPPPSTAGFGQIVGEQASSDADGDGLETHLADD